MDKKIYLLLVFLIAFFLCSYFHPKRPIVVKPLLLEPEHLVDESSPIFKEFVNNLNTKYDNIKNIIYADVSIKIDGINLDGQILYEKNNKFHMTNRSFFGKETDIGSNESYFWFWSKRLDPPAVYMAKHTDLNFTRLKTPFHPVWLMELLGINPILGDYQICRHKDKIAIIQDRTSAMGEAVKRIYLIDPDKTAIVGHYLYQSNGNLIVSAEILDFYEINNIYFPKLMCIKWPEENVELTWKLSVPFINKEINKSNWQCNLNNRKIDLNGYTP